MCNPLPTRYLLKFSKLSPTPLEIIESVDMMRVLEHGDKVKMIRTNSESYAVDTPEDLKHVESLMSTDPIISQYLD